MINKKKIPEKKDILWVGSLLKLSDLEDGLVASAAAVRWQTGLADGILDKKFSITCLNKPGGSYWPYDEFILGRKKPHFFRDIYGKEIRFINLPKIRTYLSSRAYLLAFKSIIRNSGSPSLAVFFNITVQNIKLFHVLKYQYNIPCVILAADIPSKENSESKMYMDACEEAEGTIYLSRSEFLNSPLKNKIHIDGGISKKILDYRFNNIPKAKSYFMYTGAFESYCGVDLILDSLKYAKNDFQLIICGTCKNKNLLTRFESDSRIEYKGFVSEETLEELSRHALGFINSYLPSAPECEGKFPSKLFEYLSYGRPVVSTLTSGISPDFEEVLFVVKEENANKMAKQLDIIVNKYNSDDNFQAHKNKVFLEAKTWESQSIRFLRFVEDYLV